MTSNKKIESNRRNGRKSKGPVSLEGKQNSRRNAVNHRILATKVLREDDSFQEERDQSEAALMRLREALQPRDIREEMEIENISDLRTRLRLVNRAMAGEIRRQREDAKYEGTLGSLEEYDIRGEYGGSAREHQLRLTKAIDLLKGVREEVEESGVFPEALVGDLIKRFGDEDDGVVVRLFGKQTKDYMRERRPKVQYLKASLPLDPAVDKRPEIPPEPLLEKLSEEIRRLEESRAELEEQERMRMEANVERASIPADGSGRLLLRYDTTYRGQFFRGIKALQETQEKKRSALPAHGGAVEPTTLTVVDPSNAA